MIKNNKKWYGVDFYKDYSRIDTASDLLYALNQYENDESNNITVQSIWARCAYNTFTYSSMLSIAIENNKVKSINSLLDIFKIPTDLTLKERIAYYQLLKMDK